MARSRIAAGDSVDGASSSRRQSFGESATVLPSLATAGASTKSPCWVCPREAISLQVREEGPHGGHLASDGGVRETGLTSGRRATRRPGAGELSQVLRLDPDRAGEDQELPNVSIVIASRVARRRFREPGFVRLSHLSGDIDE